MNPGWEDRTARRGPGPRSTYVTLGMEQRFGQSHMSHSAEYSLGIGPAPISSGSFALFAASTPRKDRGRQTGQLPHLLSDPGIAIAAVHGSVSAGLEGHFSVLATLSAYRREHLAPGLEAGTVLAGPLGPAGLAASRAAFGLIGIALRLEELLLVCAERELGATIDTLKCLVL